MLTLQALAYDRQGKVEDALDVLERALILTAPGGWVWPFLESGPTMAALLERLAERRKDRTHVDRPRSPAQPPPTLPPDGSRGADRDRPSTGSTEPMNPFVDDLAKYPIGEWDPSLGVRDGAKEANESERVLNDLEPYGDGIEGLVAESTYNWYWLMDGLMATGYRVHLANTAAIVQSEGLKYADDDTALR